MALLVVYFFLAVGVSFLCSILEAVLLSVTPAHLAVMVERGSASGHLLRRLKQDIDRPLSAILSLNTLIPPKQEEGIFSALMRVTRGAFRFTTTEIGKLRKRNVDVKIGHVTVGIRGTDIWGRSRTDEDLFCLIEGNVTVQREGEAEFTMQDPLKYIVAEKDKPTSAVMPVDMNELGGWAAETETQQGQGILTASGEWAVNMMSLQNTDAANRLQQVLLLSADVALPVRNTGSASSFLCRVIGFGELFTRQAKCANIQTILLTRTFS